MMIRSTVKPSPQVVHLHEQASNHTTIHPLYKIGAGGFGSVFLAEEKGYDKNRIVAIKRSQPSSSACIMTEANIHSRLNHPNIVAALDIRSLDNQPSLVMEFVAGTDINTHIQEEQIQDWYTLEPLIEQLLDAIEYIHQQGIIHCDLKPSNILVAFEDTPQIKIIDFGAAQNIGQIEPHRMYGTPYFMAPEQCHSPHSIDERTDIFAIGKLIQRLLENNLCYDNTTLDYLCNDDPDFYTYDTEMNSNCPSYVRQAILIATQKNMNVRYRTIDDLRFALGLGKTITAIAG